MQEKRKRKLKTIFAILIIAAAITFAVVTSIVLNNINKEYDDLDDKNQNLPQIAVEISNQKF